MMKLYSIGNRSKFNYYTFDKKNDVIIFLMKSLTGIFGFNFDWYKEYKTKDGKTKFRKINFEKIRDKHISDVSTNESVDLFFGDKKIFVTINCNTSKRKKFNEELKDFVMPKPKEKP